MVPAFEGVAKKARYSDKLREAVNAVQAAGLQSSMSHSSSLLAMKFVAHGDDCVGHVCVARAALLLIELCSEHRNAVELVAARILPDMYRKTGFRLAWRKASQQ